MNAAVRSSTPGSDVLASNGHNVPKPAEPLSLHSVLYPQHGLASSLALLDALLIFSLHLLVASSILHYIQHA